MTLETSQQGFALRLEKREGLAAGDPEARPGFLRIPQQKFIDYVRQEAGISRPSAFDRLRKLERKGLVYVNRGQGRNTFVSVDLQRFVSSFSDYRDSEKKEERLDGPFGFWAFSEEDEQRLIDMGVLERSEDGVDWRPTRTFMERFEVQMREAEARFPREDLHLGVIARVLGEMAGPDGLTLKELVSRLDLAVLAFNQEDWPDPTLHRNWTPAPLAKMVRARLLEEKTDSKGLRYWTVAPGFRGQWDAVGEQATEGREGDARRKLVQSQVFGLSDYEAALYYRFVSWILEEEETLQGNGAERPAAGS